MGGPGGLTPYAARLLRRGMSPRPCSRVPWRWLPWTLALWRPMPDGAGPRRTVAPCARATHTATVALACTGPMSTRAGKARATALAACAATDTPPATATATCALAMAVAAMATAETGPGATVARRPCATMTAAAAIARTSPVRTEADWARATVVAAAAAVNTGPAATVARRAFAMAVAASADTDTAPGMAVAGWAFATALAATADAATAPGETPAAWAFATDFATAPAAARCGRAGASVAPARAASRATAEHRAGDEPVDRGEREQERVGQADRRRRGAGDPRGAPALPATRAATAAVATEAVRLAVASRTDAGGRATVGPGLGGALERTRGAKRRTARRADARVSGVLECPGVRSVPERPAVHDETTRIDRLPGADRDRRAVDVPGERVDEVRRRARGRGERDEGEGSIEVRRTV